MPEFNLEEFQKFLGVKALTMMRDLTQISLDVLNGDKTEEEIEPEAIRLEAQAKLLEEIGTRFPSLKPNA